ncbi:hypothetical protein POM88_023613 [Heracleum sosnowskyi]|uniref:Uncharacterized protein n=1 Tax=Heracleum sosnowskyi TaxID=360622 RepID=A0AAD8MW32_9APIA|nr:hypothetical protein POM88_053666 [Heracleum sosnowskyi]KAK1385878.1 hypothetical protein POM88_023613 [Heracleum sosnowskyi]
MVLKKRSAKKKQVKFSRFVLTPVKVLLCGARDFYVNTCYDCAGRIGEGSVAMTGLVIFPQVYPMPGNCSGSSSSTKDKRSTESSRELIRVINRGNAKGNIWEGKSSAASESGSCQRSYGIGLGQIGRIDEDAPCDFVETNASNKSMIYPRCKSSAFH